MRITFRLKENRDEDLLLWFNNLGEGERSYFIRQTLRRGLVKAEHNDPLPVISVQQTSSLKPEPVTAEEAENRLSSLLNNF